MMATTMTSSATSASHYQRQSHAVKALWSGQWWNSQSQQLLQQFPGLRLDIRLAMEAVEEIWAAMRRATIKHRQGRWRSMVQSTLVWRAGMRKDAAAREAAAGRGPQLLH